MVASALHDLDVPEGAVDVDVPLDLPDVHADAGLLERVVANLVQNALRYSPVGVPVTVTASTHAGMVELRVIDRGPGIAEEDAEAVFSAFQRRGDGPANGAGVGLGLAIARGFTQAMGGSVASEETPGGGATFVVRLRAETAEITDPPAAGSGRSAAPADPVEAVPADPVEALPADRSESGPS